MFKLYQFLSLISDITKYFLDKNQKTNGNMLIFYEARLLKYNFNPF